MADRKRLERMKLLAEKWQNGTLSEAELSEFRQWLGTSADEAYPIYSEGDLDQTKHKQQLYERIVKAAGLGQPAKRLFTWRYAIVAACVILVSIVALFMVELRQEKQAPVDIASTILPGERKAELQLADGQHAWLDGADNVVVFRNNTIEYLQGGEVPLTTGKQKASEGNVNQLIIPKGGEYQVILPDGTDVWLNADSKLSFSADGFGVENREVFLEGEAFFEVQPAKLPFVVIAGKQRVEALGTSFNMKSYDNEEEAVTTLVSGRVRVALDLPCQSGCQVVLSPNEQARFEGNTLHTRRVEVGPEIAWVRGVFDFTGKGVQEVMNQLERWYDLEVSYSEEIPDMEFWGRMSRNLNLGQVLKLLKSAALSFEVKNRKQVIISTNTKGGQ